MKQHLIFTSVILLFVLMGIAGGSMAADYAGERYETTGSSYLKKDQSVPNAILSAHFKCNRKGLWADVSTMEFGKTISDRSKNPTYRTKVTFLCGNVFPRSTLVEETQ